MFQIWGGGGGGGGGGKIGELDHSGSQPHYF